MSIFCLEVTESSTGIRAWGSGNLALAIGRKPCAWLDSVSGGGITAPVSTQYVGPKQIAGGPTSDEVTVLLTDLQFGDPLVQWINAFLGGQNPPTDVTLVSLDLTNQVVSAVMFPKSRLTRVALGSIDASDKNSVTMTLAFVPGDLPRDPAANELPVGTPPPGNSSVQASCRLSIEDLDGTGVTRIDAFEATGSLLQSTLQAKDGSATGFADPGRIKLPDLIVTLSAARADSWVRWFDDFVLSGHNSDSLEKQGRLLLIPTNLNPKPIATIVFHHLGIYALGPTPWRKLASSTTKVVAKLYFEKMEWVPGLAGGTAPAGSGSVGAAQTYSGKEYIGGTGQTTLEEPVDPADRRQPAPPTDNGKIGQPYTLGRNPGAVNFTLNKLDYNANRVVTENGTLIMERSEKFIVFHYGIENTTRTAMSLGARDFRFTAFAPDGTAYNFHGDENICKDPSGDVATLMLHPGQKAAMMTAMKIPGRAAVAKIMVERGGTTLRYSLNPNDITPLAPPYVNPSSADGSEALEEFVAKPDVYVPLSPMDIRFLGVKYDSVDPAGTPLTRDSGDQWAIASFMLKNVSRTVANLSYGSEVRTSSGDKVGRAGTFKLSADAELGRGSLDKDEELGMRVSYRIPKNDTVNRLSIWYGANGRKIIFPVE